jgi:hypothetical protein
MQQADNLFDEFYTQLKEGDMQHPKDKSFSEKTRGDLIVQGTVPSNQRIQVSIQRKLLRVADHLEI